jgi:hypothetical protein
MIHIILFLIIFILYIRYGIYYALGCAEYARLNNSDKKKERTWGSVVDEFCELVKAIIQCNLIDIILELGDFIHAIITFCVITFLPKKVFSTIWCWLPFFLLALPCTIKIGERYKHYECIRNHKNKQNLNHVCQYGIPKRMGGCNS